jgi:hypothetical protein
VSHGNLLVNVPLASDRDDLGKSLQQAVVTLRSLVEGQGYSLEDLDFALNWIIKNIAEKFDGRVKSIGILPHIIGEALGERTVTQKKKKHLEKVNENDASLQKLTSERKEIEMQLHEMPKEKQEELRQAAIEQLTEQGVPRRFLLDALVTAEMCRLLQQSTNDID